MSQVDELRSKEAALQDELKKVRERIDKIRRECLHRWSDIEYFPDVESSMLMSTHPLWVRTCTICGTVQRTTNTKLAKDHLGLRREELVWGNHV